MKTEEAISKNCKKNYKQKLYHQMKKITLFIILAMQMACGPERWVPGNAKHFQMRADAKKQRELREERARSEFDNAKIQKNENQHTMKKKHQAHDRSPGHTAPGSQPGVGLPSGVKSLLIPETEYKRN